MRKLTQLLFIAFLFAINLTIAQEKSNFGRIPLTKVDEAFQKSTDQSILYSELKPVSGTEFRLVKTETDKLGMTHRTYQQYYNGVKVHFGMLKVHEKNGLRQTYNGAYFNPSELRTSANMSSFQVQNIAKQFMDSDDVFWLGEHEISKETTSKQELLILPNRKTETLSLVYAIGIGTYSPELKMGTVYIDVSNRTVIKYDNQFFNCFDVKEDKLVHSNHKLEDKKSNTLFVSGTAATAYSGSQSFEAKLDGNYVLNDETRATGSSWNLSTQGLGTKTGIITVDIQTGTDVTGSLYEFSDGNNNWTAAEMSTNEDQYALDVHWGSQLVYDYWSNEHSRNSYNGSNGALLSVVHYGNNYTNAGWAGISDTSGYMIYGDGSGSYTPLTTLDVVAHEIAHGINNATSNLDYELESGALNEGLSDIWAMVIENYSNNNYGTSKDFSQINEENGGGAFRSMSSPNSYGQPDTYGGTNWYNVVGCSPDGDSGSAGYNDYCGVHTNSGVLNYWFWLLSQGSSGTNDNGDTFSVTAIGMDDAADIVWRMQNTYLTSTSDYSDARTNAIQAAVDLFGSCSSQEQSVTNAFYAVGVGVEYTVVNPSITSQPSNESGCEAIDYSFTAAGSDYDSVQWQVNDGGGWSDVSNDATYSGATSTTLNITSATFAMDTYQYRLQLTNSCSSLNSNSVTLTIEENPEATISVQDETCTGGDGSITFTYPDNSARTGIEFSIDGGSSYPYEYDDSLGSQTLSSLAAATYNVWVRWGNTECPLELGDYMINAGSTPTASVTGTTNESCTLNDGVIAVSFSDAAAQTQIDFSIDGGVNYDYSFDDTLGTESITGLGQGDYNIWASYGGNCAVDLGTFTVDSDAPVTTVTAIDSSIGGADGGFSVTFTDNPSRGLLKFSIDGGVNYDYPFNDNLGSGSITGLAAATYNVWVAWGNDECPIELGDYTINESSDYTSIPDSNFENALYDLGYDDLLGDSKVPTALINTVTSLNVAYESIADITGIEAFVAMTNFDCSNNSLTSIDVTSNLLLDTFRCDNNLLTSIDVSTNTALLYLECFDNLLETIDVSNNLLLITLYANDNSLTSLDLSGNPVFQDLECSNNNLTYLNFKNGNNANTWNGEFEATGNTGLTCIEVDDAAYSTGAWDNIDTGVIFSTYCSYTAIPDANFEAALEALGYDDISGDGQVPTALINGVTTLDVDGESISDLTGIEDFIALETLDADNNTLMSIDLSTLSNLKSLNLQYNSLTSLDVTNNLNLETLAFRNNTVGSIDLTNNSKLESLAFQYNSITTIDLSNNSLLYHLAIRDNGLTSLDVSNNPAMINIYAQNVNIPSLDLTNNPVLELVAVTNNLDITYVDVRNGNNGLISSFNFSGCSNLTCVSVDNVANAEASSWNVHANTSYTETDYCSYTAIPDANFEAELEALGYDDISGDGQVPTALIENVTQLELVDFIFGLNISDLTGIEDFIALETLTAFDNNLSSVDLSHNTLLKTLDLSDNDGLTTIDLSNNLALETLDVSGINNLTTLDVSNNTALKDLDISSSLITSNLITVIDLTNNLALETLDVSACDNLVTIDLSNNTALKTLDISKGGITAIDIANNTALTTFTATFTEITNIDFSNNSLLKKININSSSITSLDLSNNSSLQELLCQNQKDENGDEVLTSLNIQNGSNGAINDFDAAFNSNLTCILVDNLTDDYSSWDKDATASFSDTYCDYTAIPDANFEARLEALGYDDVSADGQVPTALIEVVTSLDIRSLSITDLTGLEDFTALVTLLCRANGIDTIDVSQNLLLETFTANNNSIGTIDLSNNVALKSVNLGANGLSTLDVSNNTLLESLSLQSNGGLTTLDISNNTLLKELKIYSSNIATLDVSNNTALQTLQAYSSPIATIDVTNNPDLKDFRVHNTNITTLDLSNNPDIEQLRVNDTNIETLDLSNLVALEKLYANDMSLSFLNVQNGNNGIITVFRLTNNPSLSCILVDNAADSTMDWDEVDAGVTFSDTYCRYTAIPDTNFEAHLEALGYDDISSDGQVPTALIEVVTSLTAQFEDIVDFTGIEDFTALESLAVSYNSFTDLDVSNNTNLTFLNCGYSLLTNLDVSNNILLETLWVNTTNLSSLDLSLNTNLTSLTASAISNLTTLNMQNGNNTNVTNFTTAGNSNLPCVLVDDLVNDYSSWAKEVTTSFSDTYCNYTSIPDANFEATLEALGYDDISSDGQVPTALIEGVTTLDVSSSSIANLTGIEDFIALTDLNASDNLLVSIDISANTILTSLSLHSNSLTSVDVTNNTLLTSLSVSFNELTAIDITNNVLLESFYCNSNDITDIDVSLNTNIQFSNFSDNEFTALDFSGNSLLKFSSFNNNNLESLNVQNGTNESLVLYISASGNPNLTCILVDNVAYSISNWADIDVTSSFSETSCESVVIAPKVFLQGALLNPNTGEENWMRDDLRVGGGIYGPNSPYGDGRTITESIGLDDAGSNSTVDWIWVELRDATDPTIVIAGQSAILQRDGDVVDVAEDRTTPLTFENVAEGVYYVVVKHRNHLGVMTASTIALTDTVTSINFTDATNEITYGTNAQTSFGMPNEVVAMWAGNVNGDSQVRYQGSDNDTNSIKDNVLADGGNTSSSNLYVFTDYNYGDVDLNTSIRYQGSDNDSNTIKDIILAHPENTTSSNLYVIEEQLPEN